MSFCGTCTICTDYFDAENDISVTPCGHLFHGVCLNQWIKTCGAQRSCPQCRTRVTTNQIVSKIFLNIPEENNTQLDPFYLKNKVNELECKLKKLEKEKLELKSSFEAMEEVNEMSATKIKDLKNTVKQEQAVVHLLKTDMETLKREVESVRECKEETRRLRIRLKVLEKVEICLNGNKLQVNNMMKQYTSESSTNEMTQLATFCVAMKQEYENIKESRSNMNNEVMKLKRKLHQKNELLLAKVSALEGLESCNSNLLKNEEMLNNENQCLKKKLSALQQAITSPSDTRSSAISRLIAESPAPEFLSPICDITNTSSTRNPLNLDPIPMKKPKLSASLDSEDVDLNELVEDCENLSSPVDSPHTNKMKQHCMEMGMPFVKTTSLEKTGRLKLKSNLVNASLFRSKLVSSKKTSSAFLAYDGLGGHQKLGPPRTNTGTLKSSAKFSSTNSSKFKVPNTVNPNNRFDRFKRLKSQK